MSALRCAALIGRFSAEYVVALFSTGMIDINEVDNGWTSLMLSARQGYPRIAKVLLNKGVNICIRS